MVVRGNDLKKKSRILSLCSCWYLHQNSLSDGASKFLPSTRSLKVWVFILSPAQFLTDHKRGAGRKIGLVVAGTALAYEAPVVYYVSFVSQTPPSN